MADLPAVGVVILAAGSSRRLGRPKQRVILDGRPLLQHVIDTAGAGSPREIVVVLGHDADSIAGEIRLPGNGRFVVNRDHASGQASSLRAGIEALPDEVERAVVLLGDQPTVAAGTVRSVSDGPGPIRRARYRGTFAHPVAFDRAVWPELVLIAGDVGARDLMARRPELVVAVDIDAPAPVDVDTEQDVRALGAA